MDKTKIDWCDSTWNPVTGCLHGCEYCYARRIANRFKGHADLDYFMKLEEHPEIVDEKVHVLDTPLARYDLEASVAPYPYGFDPTFHRYRLNDYIGKKCRNIFVCSMADLFGKWVPDSWIEEVFKACERAPQHNYLFLTKNPKRYAEIEEKGILRHVDNIWYGASVTDEKSLNDVADIFGNIDCDVKTFFSAEPILEDITSAKMWNDCVADGYVDWLIVGAETGRRKDKVIPKREWIEQIMEDCRKYDIPLFMKSSLADIWSEPLIQEFPKELRK